ncbi:unnamed protein product [Coffea canephora]|uniref:Phosphoribulokinase/uridine kinase domain-containing protein n=1 Tax=Coffea canephora TaxID=49390 RepID=A0A068U8D3_COFCA|nr:unnamed protein product [Coffea canephora]
MIIVDRNFNDPCLTDYETLLKNIQDLKARKQVEVPIYDFKSNSRIGYRTLEVPNCRIVIIEGVCVYASSEKLRPLVETANSHRITPSHPESIRIFIIFTIFFNYFYLSYFFTIFRILNISKIRISPRPRPICRDRCKTVLAATMTLNHELGQEGPYAPCTMWMGHLRVRLISTLNARMDDFTSQVEEFSSKLTSRLSFPPSQNLVSQAETCNDFAPTSHFISGLENGSLTRGIMPSSSSSFLSGKDAPLLEAKSNTARGQLQIMHQLDNLSSLNHENLEERAHPGSINKSSEMAYVDPAGASLILTFAIGGLGILFFKGYAPPN